MWLNHHEATEKHSEAMNKMTEHSEAMNKMTELFNKLNDKIDKLSQTQPQIFPNVKHNQLNNSANSDHHHEYNMFEEEQLNEVELEISSHEGYSVELPRSRDSEINHENYRVEKPKE